MDDLDIEMPAQNNDNKKAFLVFEHNMNVQWE